MSVYYEPWWDWRYNLKILFVYPDLIPHVFDWPGYFHYGIGTMSAVLKQAGHQTSLIHIAQTMNEFDFIKRVKSADPDLIGFSSTSHMFSIVKKFVSWLREAKIRVPTICGGIHPTIAPEESISAEVIDIICRGEGEAPLLELCQKIENKEDISHIQNLWIKKDGTIIRNPLRPLLNDLDSLPFPDRTLFSYPTLYPEIEGRGVFLASRGCPYNCTYCCNHLLREIYGSEGKPIRFRSVDNVIGEIKQVLEHYPFINSLAFDDDILFLHRKWAEEFAEKYGREIHLPFMCNARADVTDEAIVSLLKKAGCYYVKFGLESGNEEIRHKVLNRRMTNEQIVKAFSICKKAGLITHSYNIVGIPYETPAAILDTIKLNAVIGVDIMHVTIYQPYPGTKLAEICREQNFLESKDLPLDFCSSSILKLSTVTSSQVLMFRDYFRVLTRYYQLLQKLPRGISQVSVRLSDRILSFSFTSKVLNLIYFPLRLFYQRFISIKSKEKKVVFTISGETSSPK